jgi:hypothetical protein
MVNCLFSIQPSLGSLVNSLASCRLPFHFNGKEALHVTSFGKWKVGRSARVPVPNWSLTDLQVLIGPLGASGL